MKTFDEISKDIPFLKEVERICCLVRMDQANRANEIWYKVIKPVVVKNVGFEAQDEDYKDSESYDTVYRHLCNILGGK